MKKADAVTALEKGSVLVVAEWRSGEAIEINGTSAKTGKPYSMKRVEHNIEVGGKPLTMAELLPDATKVSEYKVPFTKGQPVLVKVNLEDMGKGVWRVTGEFTPYSAA